MTATPPPPTSAPVSHSPFPDRGEIRGTLTYERVRHAGHHAAAERV